ncbi:MAG: aminopeptidase [Erysipelotrichaceae bacterium]|nr:aminopeptidase [Erysipelotrichaceae bacterium]MDY5251758.1 aminopeptidase [Erysipelotrichaceae bacterium]
MKQELLEKYAKLIVVKGANVQPGQYVVINAPVHAADFAKLCVKYAYEAQASYVELRYNDDELSKLHYQYANVDKLCEVPQWMLDRTQYAIDNQYCVIHIISEIPHLFDDIDSELMAKVNIARRKAFKPYQYYTMNNIGQWTIAAYPSHAWATKLFPDLNADQAWETLFIKILETVRVDQEHDPVALWQVHNQKLIDHCRLMNDYNFASLHFTNSVGTDLHVGLVKGHIWQGGQDLTPKGVAFNPNMPTEEIFTMPDCYNVNGKVVATLPLSHDGKLFEDFSFTFKDGKIIEFDSRTEKEFLGKILNMDEGSSRIGEVALISYDSPISNQQILYYNTLFDENASCHLALGACYPTNIKDGENMDEKTLLEHGGNSSMNHIDFMFGSKDMNIVGTTYDGQQIQIFKDGNFCI